MPVNARPTAATLPAETILLAHSRGAADDAHWAGIGNATAGVHRFSLHQLAAVLAAPGLAAAGRTPANGLATEALIARLLHELRQRDALDYFKPVAATPGFARALARTLSELRLDTVSPSDLRSAGGRPGHDLSLCLENFARQLDSNRLADLALIYELALAAPPSRFSGLPIVLLGISPSGPDAPRGELPRRLLRLLTERSRDVQTFTPPPEALPPSASALARVRNFIFSPAVSTPQPDHGTPETTPSDAATDDTLDFFSAAGEALEAVEIARRALQRAAAGIPFDRMAVVLRTPDAYQPLLQEAFRRARIPAFFTRGVQRPDAAGRAFLALLGCALQKLSASKFAEYLSLNQVPSHAAQPIDTGAPPPDDELYRAFLGPNPSSDASYTPTDTTPELDADPASAVLAGNLQSPANWERILVDAAVIGGADRWERRLEGWRQELEIRLARTAGEDREHDYLRKELVRLGHLRAFALPLIRRLHELPGSGSWGEWLDALDSLALASLRKPDSVRAVLAELRPMSDITPVTLGEVYGVLEDRLRLLRREPPGRRAGRIFVCSADEASGRSFDLVFLPGLSEGQFPRRVSEDPLLLDHHRAQISARRPDLPSLENNQTRRQRERHLLRIAVNAGARVVFSYPRFDLAEARPRVPSFYALELIRAALGFLPELRAFQEEAAGRAPTSLDRLAPDHAADAIDGAEYDLVALQTIRQAPRAESRGAMRYLLNVNDNLARSLRAHHQRWRNRQWTAADGLFTTARPVLDLLAHQQPSARPYSPTALQHYAACPYRFYLHSILGLRPRQAPAPLQQMDPLTRGAIFHEVQRDIYRWLLRTPGALPVTPTNLPATQLEADRILNAASISYSDKLAPAIPGVWLAEIEEVRADLHGWIHHVASSADWLPLYVEYSFGLPLEPGVDPASRRDPVVLSFGPQLRGRIDLVEQHSSRASLRVVDHKTGRPPEQRQIRLGGGTALQPAFYAISLEQILGAPVEAGRLFFCTQRGNYEHREVVLTPQTRDCATRSLAIIDRAISAGRLAASPARGACQFCDFRTVCGPHEELRSRRKAPLDELDDLRSMQ